MNPDPYFVSRLSLCLHDVKALSEQELSIEAVSLLSAALMLGRNYQLSDGYERSVD